MAGKLHTLQNKKHLNVAGKLHTLQKKKHLNVAGKLTWQTSSARYSHATTRKDWFYVALHLACLWLLSRNKANGKYRSRTDEILFIDAGNMGHLINRRTREFWQEDIEKIAQTYHNWRNPNSNYEDVKGFCNSASIERVRELDYVLTPGRYVGLPDEEDDFGFKERFIQLKAEFEEPLKEEARLNALIPENLQKVKRNELEITDSEFKNILSIWCNNVISGGWIDG